MVNLICQTCGNEFEALRRDAKRCIKCRFARRERFDKCPLCGKDKYFRANLCFSCYHESQKGGGNPMWKGGRSIHSNGYVTIRKPSDYKGEGKHRYILEHRYVWEQAHGPIPRGHILHHLNGDKKDNRLQNLCALPRKAHKPDQITEPYRKRIRELEAELSQRRLSDMFPTS